MALFSKKKPETADKKTEKIEKTSKVEKSTALSSPARSLPTGSRNIHLIKRPRITEKATMHNEKDVYVFEEAEDANKYTIAASIQELYKVTPRKIRTTRIPRKQVFVRGHFGSKAGGKKAYVYLKKGDKIEVV